MKRDAKSARAVILQAARLAPGAVVANAEDVPSYSVVAASSVRETRAAARRRTRLHSAKLLDASGQFLCEAAIHDRSPEGMRLLLSRNIGLPARFAVHDDLSGEIVAVTAAWRRDRAIGVRMLRWVSAPDLKPSARAALRGRYYAVPD